MKWIKCSERMPENETDCLCYFRGEYNVCFYDRRKGMQVWQPDDDQCRHPWVETDATHWMPLPDPPEGDE